ncbi:MAG: choline-sulfatase, partial [Pseudomonadota bacterium]
LLPTMLEIAGGDEGMLGAPIDGRSLMPLARGAADPVDEAIGEYCAEMTPWPVYMIRRGRLKYIHCEVDPPQLYDLARDPMERTNRAADPADAEAAAACAAEVAARWDSAQLRADVIATQKARRALHAAMEAGAGAAWDYNPPRDASQEYVRNHMDWTVAAARYRYPPVPEAEQ